MTKKLILVALAFSPTSFAGCLQRAQSTDRDPTNAKRVTQSKTLVKFARVKKLNPCKNRGLVILYGGERGIRTLDTRLTYTPLAGARLQPLGHFSVSLTMPTISTQICLIAVNVSGGMISHCARNQRLVSFFSPDFEPSDSF